MRKISLIMICMLMTLSGCGTTLAVKTNPTGADFVLEGSGISGQSDAKVSLPRAAFAAGRHLEDNLVIKKEGYETIVIPVSLSKRRTNETTPEVITLQPLDTKLTITSEPAGARMQFNLDESELPEGWSSTFVTPATFTTSSSVAEKIAGKLALSNMTVTGRIPTSHRVGTPLGLTPGEHTTVSVAFKPVLTTLEVMTDPEGAYVEDYRPGGFGYLGETPVRRTFTAEDIEQWAERDEVATRDGAFDALTINLRISKPGHEDVYLDQVKIPIGERRGFKRTLPQVAGRVSFSTDPEGVHVYVQRESTRIVFDDRTGEKKKVKVTNKVHLGATPFTLNVDPANPLRHGETLIWEKTGYQSAETVYAADNRSIHHVMQQ